jgi:Mn2+/Fe2+ NRAMP family transporter
MNKKSSDLNAPDEDLGWNTFLSSAAQLSETDHNSTDVVLSAIRLEREHGADPTWTGYLSKAVQLRPVDMAAIAPTLEAVRLERQKRKVLRLTLTRAFAGFAAAAVAAVAFVVFTPSASADPAEAYSAYQEANIGW